MPLLSNQCQCKIAFSACNFCQNTSFRQLETKPIVWSLPFYFYVWLHIYFDTERNCLKWPLESIGLKYHLAIAFCIIILTVYSTGCHDKCSKTGNTKSFSKTIYGAPYWVNKKYKVLYSPDFKYKVDSFNLYIIENYVKRTIGRCIPQIK